MGAPDETMPHPKAHIGANHVMGFRSSTTAEAVGRAGPERVETKFSMPQRLSAAQTIVNQT
jgi:hypothetical protein